MLDLENVQEYLITPNIVRAIKKVKKDQTKLFINDLVDPMVHTEFNELFNLSEIAAEEFSITKEFQAAYLMVKKNLAENSDDTQVLNTAQRFLQFMLNNELKINGIDAVKSFKEAVFQILDEEDPKLKDKIVDKFNQLVEV